MYEISLSTETKRGTKITAHFQLHDKFPAFRGESAFRYSNPNVIQLTHTHTTDTTHTTHTHTIRLLVFVLTRLGLSRLYQSM